MQQYQITFTGFITNPEDMNTYFAAPLDHYQIYSDMNQTTSFPTFTTNQFHLIQAPLAQIFKSNCIQFKETTAQDQQNLIHNPPHHNQFYPFAENIPSIDLQQSHQIKNKQKQNIVVQQFSSSKKQRLNIEKTKIIKSQKNLKKNTESNIINNIFSFITSKLKSQKLVQKILSNPDQVNIFYIFVNNLKKLNGRYLNRRNVQAICQLEDKKQQAKALAKSIKRLLILPIPLLRKVIRRIVFSYLRGCYSLFPLLTSKKICKQAIKQHLQKKRQIISFLENNLHKINQ